MSWHCILVCSRAERIRSSCKRKLLNYDRLFSFGQRFCNSFFIFHACKIIGTLYLGAVSFI